MNNSSSKKRVLICTFIALVSGLFGGVMGGQISMAVVSYQCNIKAKQTFPIPGVNTICQALVTPRSLWEGSTTGLWTGTILGAFAGGLATHKTLEAEIKDK